MPLNEILDKIEEETKEQEKSILEEARNKAENILKETESKKEQIYQTFNNKGKEEIEDIRREKTSSATLEGRTMVERAIEDIEIKFEESLLEELKKFKETEQYLQYLTKIIEESWKKLGPGSLVYLNPDDNERLSNSALPLTFIPRKVDPIGGVIVTSADGKIYIDSTFTEVLRGKKEKILKIARDYIR